MGFNHCYVGNILRIQEELEKVGLEKFVKRYQKYDAISGESDSINFIEEKVKLWHTTNLDGTQKVDQTNL
jgi:hypothetical protein